MIFTVYLSPLQSPGVQNPQVFKQCTWINTWPSTHQGHKLPFPHSINCCLGHSKSRTVLWTSTKKMGFPGKELVYQCRRQRFDPWVRKIPWRRKWKCILSILFFFSNILAWEIPWTEEPSGVQSKGLQRLGNHSAIKTTTTTERTWVESTCTPIWTCCSSLEGTGHPRALGSLNFSARKLSDNEAITFDPRTMIL